MAYPEKVTYNEKYNLRPIVEPDGQWSAQNANEIKDKLNKNALFHDVHETLSALQAAHPNPPVGAFAYLKDGSHYRCVNVGWTTNEGSGSTYFKGYFLSLADLKAAFPISTPGARAIIKVAGANDQEALWDEDDQDWFAFSFQTDTPTSNGIEIQEWTAGWKGGFDYHPYLKISVHDTSYTDSRDLTVGASDPNLHRSDLFAFHLETHQLALLPGTPGPVAIAPEYDPLVYFPIRPITIPAGSTAPEGMSGELVYNGDEPSAWEMYIHALYDWESTNGNMGGTYCMEVVGELGPASLLPFNAPAPVPVVSGAELQFKIKNISTAGGQLYLGFVGKDKNGKVVRQDIIPSSWDSNSLLVQLISVLIPTSKIVNLTNFYLGIRNISGAKYFLDDVKLISGGEAVPVGYVTHEELEAKADETLQAAKDYADAADDDLALQIDEVEEDVLNHESRINALETAPPSGLTQDDIDVPVVVSTSRNLAATDIGKVLFITATVTLTYPTGGIPKFKCNIMCSETGLGTLAGQAAELDFPDGQGIEARKAVTLFLRPDDSRLTGYGEFTT